MEILSLFPRYILFEDSNYLVFDILLEERKYTSCTCNTCTYPFSCSSYSYLDGRDVQLKGERRDESRRDYMGREIASGRPSVAKRCFRRLFFDSFAQIEIFKRFG